MDQPDPGSVLTGAFWRELLIHPEAVIAPHLSDPPSIFNSGESWAL